jgi:hypothetical protein
MVNQRATEDIKNWTLTANWPARGLIAELIMAPKVGELKLLAQDLIASQATISS